MKIFITKLFALLFLSIILTGPISAAPNLKNAFPGGDPAIYDDEDPADGFSPLASVAEGSGYNPDNTFDSMVGQIIMTGLSLLGIIFLVLIIYAGYLWMTATGNEEKVSKAKSIMTMAIIGLIIVLSAYAISYFVLSSLTGEALQDTSIE